MTPPPHGGATRPADDAPDLAGDLEEELAELATNEAPRGPGNLPADRFFDGQLGQSRDERCA